MDTISQQSRASGEIIEKRQDNPAASAALYRDTQMSGGFAIATPPVMNNPAASAAI
jgi:hypothetical protein